MSSYQDFLKTKIKRHVESGFEIAESDLNAHLFDFQRYIVKRALRAGKFAIFADCGFVQAKKNVRSAMAGKSVMSLFQ